VVLTDNSFGAIVLALFSFILLATFPGWHAEEDELTGSVIDVKPFPSRPVTQVAFFLAAISAVFAGIAALWQHASAASSVIILEEVTSKFIKVSTGPGAIALAWLGATFPVFASVGILVILVSLSILDQMVGS
jgi:hypothetical protein